MVGRGNDGYVELNGCKVQDGVLKRRHVLASYSILSAGLLAACWGLASDGLLFQENKSEHRVDNLAALFHGALRQVTQRPVRTPTNIVPLSYPARDALEPVAARVGSGKIKSLGAWTWQPWPSAAWMPSVAAYAAAAADAPIKPKKPLNPFSIWLAQERPALVEEAGTKSVAIIGKLAGEKWRAMSESQKAPFEEKFVEAKALYAKDLEKFIAAGGQVPEKPQKTTGPKAPPKPPSSYMIWLAENRAAIVKEAGSSKVPVVGKLAGEKWKAMSQDQKAVYEKQAEARKVEYQKTIQDFEAQGGIVAAKIKPVKGKGDPDKPKQPQSAYFLWLGDNRAAFAKELGSSKPTEVSKLAGARWKELTDAKKAPYQAKADEKKKEYKAAMEEYNRKKASSEEED